MDEGAGAIRRCRWNTIAFDTAGPSIKSKGVMKKIIISMCIVVSTSAFSSVNCIGVPQATKVGEFGAQESYLIATVNNLDFRLGQLTDQGARSRLAIATAALAANKPLLLRFWDPYNDCSAASNAQAIPNSTQILQ